MAEVARISVFLILLSITYLSTINSAEASDSDQPKASFSWQMIGNERKPLDPKIKEQYKQELDKELNRARDLLRAELSDPYYQPAH